MRKIILIIIIISGFTSCYTYQRFIREIEPKITNRIGEIDISIRSVIQFDGYYQSYTTREDNPEYISEFNQMFFEDGTCATNFFFEKNATKEDISKNMLENIEYRVTNRNDTIWGGNWGIYRVQNDTIIVQVFVKGDIIVPWSFYERRYKIINKTTLEFIDYKPLLIGEREYTEEELRIMSSNIERTQLSFHPVESLPPSNPWFKKKRWAWKNESDWEKYMQSLKR